MIRGHDSGELTIRTVINKTRRPLKISLHHGKTLHLGPGAKGQVHNDTLERPAFKKMVEADEIEVLDEDGRSTAADQTQGRIQGSTQGHPADRKGSRRGDR
jgi:hypothetical protein